MHALCAPFAFDIFCLNFSSSSSLTYTRICDLHSLLICIHPLHQLSVVSMDEVYRARLSAEPPGPSAGKAPQPHPDDIHIQSHPVNPPGGFPNSGQPVPIQLPNIYVNPFPSGTAHHESLHRNDDHDGTIHRNGPINVPSISHRKSHSIKIGPFRFAKPHPLLWVCLFLSVLALVLEVPRGSLPTLTGRHKSLRVSTGQPDPQKCHKDLWRHVSDIDMM